MQFNKKLVMVGAITAALVFAGCKAKTPAETNQVPDSYPLATVGPSIAPTLQKNVMHPDQVQGAQTPEQEIDTAIQQMDTAVNANNSNDFKAADFN